MAEQIHLQLLKGNTAKNDVYTGIEGELTYDTQKKEVRVHDGVTVGGISVGSGSVAEGVYNLNEAEGAISVKYDWIGTEEQYNNQNVATLHPDWICYITDDTTSGSGGDVNIDNSTITKNSSGDIQTVAVKNQNTATGATTPIYDWIGTVAEYEEQDILNKHPEWVCYITDDDSDGEEEDITFYTITGRNVGDIFFTSRTDTLLNGAVSCDGATYKVSDYEGEESIGELLRGKKLPYISFSEYSSLLTSNGNVGVFAWDGGDEFRVPTIKNIFLEAGEASKLGEYVSAGLPNITSGTANTFMWKNDQATIGTEGAFKQYGTEHGGLQEASLAGTRWINTVTADFKASYENSIYGNSDTVQPESIKYRAMVQIFTGETDEAARTCKEVRESVENLNEHALLDNQITNCITHIPQDIKIETNGNVISVKAGSKVYIPNGFESDGTTRKFDEYILTEDSTITVGTDWETNDTFLFVNKNSSNGKATHIKYSYSGKTQPTITSDAIAWYDTTTNLIKIYNNGSIEASSDISLPVAIFRNVNGTGLQGIRQVFNGFGYIGVSTFTIPGLTILCPIGFNEDGSYKNRKVINNRVYVSDLNEQFSHNYVFYNDGVTDCVYLHGWGEPYSFIESDDRPDVIDSDTIKNLLWYNTRENKIYHKLSTQSEISQYYGVFGNGGFMEKLSLEATTFSKFDIARGKPFKALDKTETHYIAHQSFPSNKYMSLSLGASGTTYTAPADGYVRASGISTAAGGFINIESIPGFYGQSIAASSNQQCVVSTVVSKGQTFAVTYGNLTFDSIRFTYANGAI